MVNLLNRLKTIKKIFFVNITIFNKLQDKTFSTVLSCLRTLYKSLSNVIIDYEEFIKNIRRYKLYRDRNSIYIFNNYYEDLIKLENECNDLIKNF